MADNRSKKMKPAANIAVGLIILAAAMLPAEAQSTVDRERSARDFDVQKISKGVYALIRTEHPSLWFNPNNIFIVGDRDVIVVDSNISSRYTLEVLAALKTITNKPVRYVINTHWHEDHIIGNRVYRDAFPGVQFIGHRSTLTDLPTIGAVNRKGSVENGPGFVELLGKQIDKGENLAGKKITEEERDGYSSDIKIVRSYLSESKDLEIIPPSVLVDERMDIDHDGRKIEVRFLGRAHTGADLTVFLPREKILFSGDLIVWPVPLIGSTSYPLEYGATLEKLLALDAKVIVPGHGPVMRDAKYVALLIGLLESIKRQAEAAFARGDTLDEFRRSIDLERHRKAICGDSQHRNFVFQNYVVLPATAAAHRQLAERTKPASPGKGVGTPDPQ